MLLSTKIAILALGAAGLSGGGLIVAASDPHPVVNMTEISRPAIAGPQHDLAPLASVEGFDYDAQGNIVSARIDGLEAPASATPQQSDIPVS